MAGDHSTPAELNGDVHPAAAVFPMLPDDELQALADSIADVGLLQPIVLTDAGAVLDGRNRLAACKVAGVKPTFVVHDGDPVAFVAASNVNRRHMTTGARAMAVAVMLNDAGRRDNGKWSYGAVPNGEVSNHSGWKLAMAQAGHVIDAVPDLASAVIAGALSLHAAHGEATRAREEAESVEARFARLPADLATLVREERMTLDEAEAAGQARERKRVEEQRDARGLLTRIVDLAAPPVSEQFDADAFIDAWAGRLGDVDADLVDRLDTSIEVLTQLAKRVHQ